MDSSGSSTVRVAVASAMAALTGLRKLRESMMERTSEVNYDLEVIQCGLFLFAKPGPHCSL